VKTHPAIKILVIAFSLTVGALIVWQMKGNMSGDDAETPANTETTKEQKKEPAPVIISTKNPAGSVKLRDVEQILPDFKKEPKKQPPLLPSSKSGLVLPPQEKIKPNQPSTQE